MAFPRKDDNGGKLSEALKGAIGLSREVGSWALVIRLWSGVVAIVARHVGEVAKEVAALHLEVVGDDTESGRASGKGARARPDAPPPTPDAGTAPAPSPEA